MTKWQPMETAPKDRRILLRRPGRISNGIGRYESQQFAKRPKPYWADDRSYVGVQDCRAAEPTGWMEIPE